MGKEEKKVVLVIEDDAETVMLFHLALKQHGIKMVAKLSGEEGLAAMNAVRPDLVLLDIMMPGMDGWEVYQRMKASPRLAGIPVIVVTARVEAVAKMYGQCFDKAADYVVKPFGVRSLINKVQYHLTAQTKSCIGESHSLPGGQEEAPG